MQGLRRIVGSAALVLASSMAAQAADFRPTPRFPKGLAAMKLGAAPHGLETWDPGACSSCHQAEVDSWSLSAHHEARSGFFFLASLAKEDPKWCVRCHAPESTSLGRAAPAPDAPAGEHGVGCAPCHADQTRESLKDPSLCAGCHQFGFAVRDRRGQLARLSDMPQQDTWGEWDRWRSATGDARTCVSCHMPGGDHSMGGRRLLEMIRRSFVVDVGPSRTLLVSTRDVGHRLPTGDVMRWIVVEAAADPLFEEPVALARFGRTLAVAVRPPEPRPYLGMAANTTLPASGTSQPQSIRVPARDARGRPLVAWRVVYHLASEAQERDGRFPLGTSTFVLASGLLEESP